MSRSSAASPVCRPLGRADGSVQTTLASNTISLPINMLAFGQALRAVPKTHAVIWRSKRLPVMNRAASKVMMRDMVVLPS